MNGDEDYAALEAYKLRMMANEHGRDVLRRTQEVIDRIRLQHDLTWAALAKAQEQQRQTRAALDRMDERRRRYRWWKPWTW